MSYYRSQLEGWLKTLEINAENVLDIGGSANPVSKRVGKWNVKNYSLLDNNTELTFHNKWIPPHFTYDIQSKKCREIRDYYNHKYDTIFCLEVFEYILSPIEAINNIRYLLTDKGVLYITFPFVYPYHQPIEADYLRYTKSAVEKLLSEFTEFSFIPRVDKSGLLTAFYTNDGMRMAKGQNHNVTGFLVRAVK